MNTIYENENCPVCYSEYTYDDELLFNGLFDDDETDYENYEISCVPCCGHKLCEPCRDTILFSNNPYCPICRINWDSDNEDEDEDDEDEDEDDDEEEEEGNLRGYVSGTDDWDTSLIIYNSGSDIL